MPASERAVRKKLPETPAARALRSAVHTVLAGATVHDSAQLHGLPDEVLKEALEQYHEGNWGAADLKPRRSGASARRKLTSEQEREIQDIVHVKTPDAIGMAEHLWTKEAVLALIHAKTGMVLPSRTLNTYLERWGFAPEKPMKSLFRRQPEVMRSWMKRDYPIIAMLAREAKAQLFWWGWVPLTPGAAAWRNDRVKGSRGQNHAGWNLLFVVTNRGHMHWMVQQGELTLVQLLELLNRLQLERASRTFLLVQDHPHFASPGFIEWSIRNKEAIEFHLVPVAS